MQDSFTVHKGHIKCTVAQKEAHWPPFLVLIFNSAIYLDGKNILYKKSLIRFIKRNQPPEGIIGLQNWAHGQRQQVVFMKHGVSRMFLFFFGRMVIFCLKSFFGGGGIRRNTVCYKKLIFYFRISSSISTINQHTNYYHFSKYVILDLFFIKRKKTKKHYRFLKNIRSCLLHPREIKMFTLITCG